MRKASREMDAAFAFEVLDKAPYVTVSMTRPDGTPYGLPLSLARTDEKTFYFHCAFTRIEQEDAHVPSLFADHDSDERAGRLSGAIDAINKTLGPGSVLFGIQGDGRFHMTQEHKSPRYTTRWTDLPKVSVK